MFAAEAQPTPLPKSPISQELTAEWQEIVAMVTPFLGEVRQQLAAQVTAFDPGIAPYAEYGLARQGKRRRAARTSMPI